MKTLKEFLNTIIDPNRRATYKKGLNAFFDYVGMKPDVYFMTERKYENDIEGFFFKNPKYRASSLMIVLLHVGAIKSYLRDSGIELADKFWRKIDKKFGRSSIKSRGVEDLDPWGVGFGDV